VCSTGVECARAWRPALLGLFARDRLAEDQNLEQVRDLGLRRSGGGLPYRMDGHAPSSRILVEDRDVTRLQTAAIIAIGVWFFPERHADAQVTIDQSI
jgi:hypothetical protein